MACLFADDTVLFADSEEQLQGVMGEYDSLCTRRKLRMYAGGKKKRETMKACMQGVALELVQMECSVM